MQKIKTILLSSYPTDKLRLMNDELGMFAVCEHKIYHVDGKKPDEIDLREFEGCDVMFALPDPQQRYGLELLTYLKEKTGLPLVGMLWHAFEYYIHNGDVFFESVYPYLKLYDTFLTHGGIEDAFYGKLLGKRFYSLGSAVDVALTGLLKNPVALTSQIIASCSRFHWNNAYMNARVSETAEGYFHEEFQSSNCNDNDVKIMSQQYALMGHEVYFVPKIPTRVGYLHELSKARLAVSLEYRHGVGRFLIDCAVAGVPCVCSNTLHASTLFRRLAVDPFDTQRADSLVFQLCNDEFFRESVVEEARSVVSQFFTVERLAERYTATIQELRGNHAKDTQR